MATISSNRTAQTTTSGPTSTYISSSISQPDFNPHTYANSLILSLNPQSTSTALTYAYNPSTAEPIDLSTPLQKTLFDLQEINSRIHDLSSSSAVEMLMYTRAQNETAQRLLGRIETERAKVVADFERLKGEVGGRVQRAIRARKVAERSLLVSRVAGLVGRVVALGRRMESEVESARIGVVGKEDFGACVRAAGVVGEFRELMRSVEEGDGNGEVGRELGKVNVVRQIRGRVFEDGEARVLEAARRVVREFGIGGLTSAGIGVGRGDEDVVWGRLRDAVHVLYLLSPVVSSATANGVSMNGQRTNGATGEFKAEYVTQALQAYMQSAVSNSAASIIRGLGQLPQLDRSLTEVSLKCQSILALEQALSTIYAPEHPLLSESTTTKEKQKKGHSDLDEADSDSDSDSDSGSFTLYRSDDSTSEQRNMLDPFLHTLDATSLGSHFWRSLASNLGPKVQSLVNQGGVSARTLKSNRDMVGGEVRNCVIRGSKLPPQLVSRGVETSQVSWDREAAVMVGSIVGPLNR